MIRRWFLIAVVLVLIAGTVLSLPACWSQPVIGQKSAQIARHWLDCVFTAASALTGTGLSRYDLGDDFSLHGQVLILVLMQAGGLIVLLAGSVIGWRIAQRWRADGPPAPAAPVPRGLIAVAIILPLLIEAIGAALIYRTQTLPEGPRLEPVLNAIFLSVSAFCNVGLTLTRDSLVADRATLLPYAIVLPLMLLGSLGAPVFYGLLRRRFGGPAQTTLLVSAVLLVAGAALMFFVESTPRWQLRNPRSDALGRLGPGEESAPQMITFSSEDDSAVQSQRMKTMTPGRRVLAALFLSQSARGGGLRMARIDEQSLAPASRALMAMLMLIGGGIGGTAGGLRILVFVGLLGAVFRRRSVTVPARWPALAAAARVLAALLVLVAATALVLIYRDTGSVEECLFEAISACCNGGLSMGLTRRLSVEGEVMIVLAMLLGRVIPLAVLAGALRAGPPASASTVSATEPAAPVRC